MLQLKKITKFIKNQCFPLNIPESSIQLSILIEVSRILCFHRVRIRTPLKVDKLQFPMIYGITFMSSGKGKDRPKGILRELSKDLLAVNTSLVSVRMDQIKSEIAREAEKEETKVLQRVYMTENRIRPVLHYFSRATVEGMQLERESYMRLGFGCMAYENEEIADAIIGQDGITEDVLNEHKTIYDNGESKTKLIKGAKDLSHVKGVPQVMQVHAAPEPLFETARATESFFKMLSSGLARRSFICYPTNVKAIRKLSYDEYILRGNKDYKEEDDIRSHFNMINYLSKAEGTHALNILTEQEIEMSAEAHKLEYVFMLDNEEKAKKEPDNTVAVELLGSHFKCKRLAGCIAVLEHPKDFTITEVDYQMAKAITQGYSAQFRKFFDEKKGKSHGELLLNFLLRKKDFCTKTELRKEIPGKTEYKTRLLNDAINELKELVSERDLLLYEEKQGASVKYKVEEKPEDEVLSEDDVVLSFSQKNDNENNSDSFTEYSCLFREFHKVSVMNKKYSPTIYKDNYATVKNSHDVNFIVLDIDNDSNPEHYSFKDGAKRFGDLACLMVTTKRHNEDINRFRVIIPIHKPIPKAKVRDVITEFFKEYKLDNDVADEITKKNSALYKGNPKQEYYYSGSKILNWERFDIPKSKKQVKVEENVSYKGGLEVSVIKLRGGEEVSPEEALTRIPENRTLPCYCPFHDDDNASAYIQKSRTGNIMFNCSGCSKFGFINLA